MKPFLKSIVIIFIFSAMVYPFRQTIKDYVQTVIAQVHSYFVPCSEPIMYKIGTFDTQFGISREYFLSALADAEAIWEKPLGRNFFAYATYGDLPVNLIYDYRQQATTKLNDLGTIAKNDQASYDRLKSQYLDLKAQYKREKNDYDSQIQKFNQDSQAYEQQIIYWNKRGGAPKNEYNKLNAERIALQIEQTRLQSLQNQINEQVDSLNATVSQLNNLADSLNLTVERYNTVGGERGEEFEEGLYSSDASGQKIDIYEFSNRQKLVRLLAHELGHALALGHVSDPKAIMYKLNTSANTILTQADIVELKTLCEIK